MLIFRELCYKNFFAKLSQATAPAGLSKALFPNYPATRPDRPDRPDPTRPDRKSKVLGNGSVRG